ncbi:hypothetical protein XJ32_02780 [Helicobacter bilis]|uniref:Cxxc_20_cxxc protein n=1 Tax=Helicobacter bilis TaxID=37372 RepID=A0A1Q2LFK2_9HELI|nr:hypothetical protein [Helicobacter bilis]AQQ59206.1 hypothetical protein XJ32_02780 [Helicobacter bilis]
MLQYIRIRELGDFKMFLYKKCEVCGNKINKLQSIWNLYLIGYGRVLYCKNCNAKYKVSQFISFLYMMLADFMPILLFFLTMLNFFEKLGFSSNVGLLFSIIVYNVFKLCILAIMPLHKVKE